MLMLILSVVCYLLGIGSMVAFFWLVEFGLNQQVVGFKTEALLHNTLLFLFFPLQHSVLARPRFKKWIQSHIHPFVERPLYVGTSGITMLPIVLLWENYGPTLYRFSFTFPFNLIVYISIALILWTTGQLNHSQMFGLRHGIAAYRKEQIPENHLKTTGIYGIVRHPLTTLLIIVLWSQETLTASRLQFNLLFTGYALLGTYLEERDLLEKEGSTYKEYRRDVPAFLPRFFRQLGRK